MRSAVSDSDVLIHFAKLRQLSLLKQLYETIPHTKASGAGMVSYKHVSGGFLCDLG